MPEESQIENAASELLGQPFDEGEAEQEFKDTLARLHEAGEKRDFAKLQIKAQQFGVAGLSAAEKIAYIDFLGKLGKHGQAQE